jgi:hypothetical protein
MSLVVSIIAKLAGKMQTMSSAILDAYQTATKFGRLQISSTDDPIPILFSLIKITPRLYIVLDSLDECSEWAEVFKLMTQMKRSGSHIHVLGISRDTGDQRRDLTGRPTITLNSDCTKGDIDTFLRHELATIADSLGKYRLEMLLFQRFSDDSQGIFLWAHLMIHTIRHASSAHEIQTILSDLPKGLGDLYASMLGKLSQESEAAPASTKKTLIWISCSSRPLLWSELQYALAIDPNEEDVDEARKPFKNAIIRLCSLLVEHETEKDIFRPIHRSINEFISRSRSDAEKTERIKRFCTPKKEAHALITATCLVSLSMPDIAESVVFNWEDFPLAAYATSDWCYHLTQSESDPLLKQRLQQFITSTSRRRT